MDTKQQIIDLYNRVDEKERTVMLAIMVIIHEGTEEEKVWLNDLVNKNDHEKSIDEIYERYNHTIQERFAQGILLQ